MVSVGEDSSYSGCLGWATLLYCGTPCAFYVIILRKNVVLQCHPVSFHHLTYQQFASLSYM